MPAYRSWTAVLVLLVSSGLRVSAQSTLEAVRPFLKQHCVRCHGPDKQENELRFDTLQPDWVNVASLEHWQAIVDQLNQGTMPPEEEPQPTAQQIEQVVDALTERLRLAYSQNKSNGGTAVMRRLNRFELRMTLRDLLYLEGDADFRYDTVTKLEDRNGNGVAQWSSEDPTREFPGDDIHDGFDNIGAALTMSDFLLDHLLTAADHCLDLATHFEPKPAALAVRHLTSPIDTRSRTLQRMAGAAESEYDGIYRRYLEPGASAGGAGRLIPDALARGVGLTGRYRITIEASAHNQTHSWGEFLGTNQAEPLKLGLLMADSQRGRAENPTTQPIRVWELPGDGSRQTLTCETSLDATWYPFLGWENGPHDRGWKPSKLVQNLFPESYRELSKKNASQEEKRTYEQAMAGVLLDGGYRGPHLRVYSVKLKPLDESWPPQSHVVLYGESDQTTIEGLLLQFAQRAFRREVTAKEVEKYVRLARSQMNTGHTRSDALRTGYVAILASPRFYYLHESEGPLDSYELASRLSYFLWSSTPDDELFDLAAADLLVDAAVLQQQVDRMLDDPKAAAFVRRFTERWLQLYKLGTMPPADGFYHHRHMEPELRDQIDAYFGDLVRTNGPIRNLIDSDYTFLNERVAQWIYQREGIHGDHFRKVPAEPPYGGGLLTMPAVMTATANGVDTSPVVRGVWMLESILGTPPSPPPPDVEPLSPDLRNARTIREQLVAHRQQQACNRCHQKIDPLGFVFENFNHLGKWRTHYDVAGKRLAIDPSATLFSGQQVKDADDLKKMLLQREQQVTRTLTEKLLTYAAGRRLESLDRGETDRIVAELKERGSGLRDLIQLVVSSDIFLTK